MGRPVTDWILMIPQHMRIDAELTRRLLAHMAQAYPDYLFRVDRPPWRVEEISVAPMMGSVGDGPRDAGTFCDKPAREMIAAIAAHAQRFDQAATYTAN